MSHRRFRHLPVRECSRVRGPGSNVECQASAADLATHFVTLVSAGSSVIDERRRILPIWAQAKRPAHDVNIRHRVVARLMTPAFGRWSVPAAHGWPDCSGLGQAVAVRRMLRARRREGLSSSNTCVGCWEAGPFRPECRRIRRPEGVGRMCHSWHPHPTTLDTVNKRSAVLSASLRTPRGRCAHIHPRRASYWEPTVG